MAKATRILGGKDAEELIRGLVLAVPLSIPFIPMVWGSARVWGTVVMVSIFCAGVLLLVRDFDKQRMLLLLRSPVLISAFIFVICAICTIPLGPYPLMKARLIDLVDFGLLPIIIMAIVPKKPTDFLVGLAFVVLCSLVMALVNIGTSAMTGFHEMPGVMDLQKNRVGELASGSGLISIAYLLTQRPKFSTKAILCVLILISFVSCLAVNARACMFSLPISAIIIAIAQVRKRRGNLWRILLVFGATGAILTVAWKLLPQEKVALLTKTESGSSVAARPYFWDLSVKFLQSKPFSPVGFGQVATFEETNSVIDNPCNFFLQEWIEVGLPGALAYSFMVFSALMINFLVCARPTTSRYLAFVAAAFLSLQLMRFARDFQDACLVGQVQAMTLYTAIGAAVFLRIGTGKHDKQALSQGNLERAD